MASFNKAVRKTNFFKTRKASLAFRLDHDYLHMDKVRAACALCKLLVLALY